MVFAWSKRPWCGRVRRGLFIFRPDGTVVGVVRFAKMGAL